MPKVNHEKPTKSIVLNIPNKLYFKVKDENDKENRKNVVKKVLLSEKIINLIQSSYEKNINAQNE